MGGEIMDEDEVAEIVRLASKLNDDEMYLAWVNLTALIAGTNGRPCVTLTEWVRKCYEANYRKTNYVAVEGSDKSEKVWDVPEGRRLARDLSKKSALSYRVVQYSDGTPTEIARYENGTDARNAKEPSDADWGKLRRTLDQKIKAASKPVKGRRRRTSSGDV